MLCIHLYRWARQMTHQLWPLGSLHGSTKGFRWEIHSGFETYEEIKVQNRSNQWLKENVGPTKFLRVNDQCQNFIPLKAGWAFSKKSNSVEWFLNSDNLTNHWSMNWSQFEDPLCDLCLHRAVVSSLYFVQEIVGSRLTFYKNVVNEFTEFSEIHFGKTSVGHITWHSRHICH